MKTFECKLIHKVDKHTKIDFIKAENAVKAVIASQKANPDWICVSADIID